MSHAPPIIGLAGGIGSGKTAVAHILRDLGCVVSDSDAGARAALRDPQIKAELVKWWGDSILEPATGEIDRAQIARIVFNDSAQRARLEALTHPWIERRRQEEFAAAPNSAPCLVIDAPLLFEAGLERVCDAVIFVDAEPRLRLQRVKKTRNWTDSDLRERESAQMPLDSKRSRADYVLDNNGDLSDLQTQVRRVLNKIVESRRS